MDSSEPELSERERAILNNMASDMGFHGDWCFYVVADQNTATYGGYLPALVFREVQSYFTMNGPLYDDIPFVIAQTIQAARRRCALMNAHIGLDDETVREIVDSAGLDGD